MSSRGPRGGASAASGGVGIFDLLFVCTGNICRSPTAHLLAAAALPPEHFRVHSAGTHGLVGEPVERSAARLLTAQGVGCDEFRATRLDTQLVEQADLILTATREHRTAVVSVAPDALRKTFTLREFARLVDPPPDLPPTNDQADRARALVAAAAARRGTVWGRPSDDDVADPYGRDGAAYDRAFREISEALRAPLAALGGTTLAP